jgi:recombination protein RecT
MSTEIVPFKQKVISVAKLLDSKKKQLAIALPKHITVERMLGVALRSIQKTPQLVECDQASLINAVFQSAQLGLECDGVLGHAFLVPFKKKVVLIPGYKGLLKLARNSGEISTIQAHEVRQKDTFKFHYGLDPILEHIPTPDDDPGGIVAFYAVARLKDGSTQFEVMWVRQVNAIRDRSEGYRAAKQYGKSTPWETDYAEMGKKTALRRLCKMLPSSVELARAISLDEEADAGIQDLDSVIDLTIDEPTNGDEQNGNGTSKLDQVVDAGKGNGGQAETPTETKAAPTETKQPAAETKAAEKKTDTKKPETKKGEQKPLGNPNYGDREGSPFDD